MTVLLELTSAPIDAAPFRTFHDASVDPFAIFRCVRVGGRIADFEWVYANHACEPLSGRVAAECVGGRLGEMSGHGIDARLITTLSLVVGSARSVISELELRDPSGAATATFRLMAVPLGDGAAISLHDVTDRREAEAERARLLEEEKRARQHAERLNRMKDEFLATMSHELRTPLQAITGWSQLLLIGGLDEGRARKGLETIDRNARIQAHLIEDILDVSAIIAGKLRIRADRVNLRQVLEAALETVRLGAIAKGVRLSSEIEPDVGHLLGDGDRLQQITWNLLANAVKFTARGGTVTLRASRTAEQVTIAVEDDGKGISPAFLPFVFDRFLQEDSGAERRHGGLGLGLAIVRHLAEAHGGTAAAASEGEGRGATFRVLLPTAASALGAPAVATESTRPGRALLEGIHLLIVDDEVDGLELHAALFERFGATVSPARSAEDAIALARTKRFDAIVSDVGMPGEDGCAFMRRLRADSAGALSTTTPAVALTAFARPEDRERALAAGFQVYLTKPLDPQLVLAAVARLTGRQSGDSFPRVDGPSGDPQRSPSD